MPYLYLSIFYAAVLCISFHRCPQGRSALTRPQALRKMMQLVVIFMYSLFLQGMLQTIIVMTGSLSREAAAPSIYIFLYFSVQNYSILFSIRILSICKIIVDILTTQKNVYLYNVFYECRSCMYFINHKNYKKLFSRQKKKRDFIILILVILLIFPTAGVHMKNVVQFKGKAKMINA